MRSAQEQSVWTKLRAKYASSPRNIVRVDRAELDLADPCIVLGGRNGAGKSRFMRNLADELGEQAIYIDLHFLSHRLLTSPTERTDIDEMLAEYSPLGPDTDRQNDLARIIGRQYESIEWFALELDNAEIDVPVHMPWLVDVLTPYFRAAYGGHPYSASDMGLGELSMHLLFWCLEQNRDRDDIVLILDEPDAYLPPTGAAALLPRLLNICLKRSWRLILSTHSAEIITQAVEKDAFVRLDIASDGAIEGTHVSSNPAVADTLLATPPPKHLVFVEDEAAYYLTKSLLRSIDRRLEKTSVITWGNGAGYLEGLHKYLPRTTKASLRYILVPDGDQRESFKLCEGERWPVVFLPTAVDPDSLFVTAGKEVEQLAERLGVLPTTLRWQLESNEGKDPHDWVNWLAEEYGRETVYTALADLWVSSNPEATSSFGDEFSAGYGSA